MTPLDIMPIGNVIQLNLLGKYCAARSRLQVLTTFLLLLINHSGVKPKNRAITLFSFGSSAPTFSRRMALEGITEVASKPGG
jgi:hypothetical protein